jgi:hypothetical protein
MIRHPSLAHDQILIIYFIYLITYQCQYYKKNKTYVVVRRENRCNLCIHNKTSSYVSDCTCIERLFYGENKAPGGNPNAFCTRFMLIEIHGYITVAALVPAVTRRIPCHGRLFQQRSEARCQMLVQYWGSGRVTVVTTVGEVSRNACRKKWFRNTAELMLKCDKTGL